MRVSHQPGALPWAVSKSYHSTQSVQECAEKLRAAVRDKRGGTITAQVEIRDDGYTFTAHNGPQVRPTATAIGVLRPAGQESDIRINLSIGQETARMAVLVTIVTIVAWLGALLIVPAMRQSVLTIVAWTLAMAALPAVRWMRLLRERRNLQTRLEEALNLYSEER